jgi:cytochrome c oxidase assembly protein subunit 15
VTRLARFARATLAWNVAVILWGAFVRASGSGAGCGAHWPLCNGEIVPRAPALETMIEFTHRLTSGAALLLVVVLAIWVWRARPRGHLARRAAFASLVFILLEAAVGAALVLFRLVAQNESGARALFMAGHLVNTFLLLAALALTFHWVGSGAPPRRDALSRHGGVFALALVLLVLVGTSGAVAALGDTLYPARSLLAGLGDDLAPTTGLLVRLRLLHPILGAAGALAAALAAARVLQSTDIAGPRRWAWTVAGLALVQVAAGLLNVVLLAPVWMQILHLFLADVLWIALVLLAAQAFALATPVVHRPPTLSLPT